MNNYRQIMDRLKLYFKVNSDKKIAEKLGINYNTIKTWSNRGKIPLEKILNRLQNETINIDWLLTGRGEMFLKDEKTPISLIPKEDSIPINYYPEVYAAAGYGAINTNLQKETIYIPKSFLIQVLNILPTYPLDIIKVIGDSMEPYIQDGETVIVERNPNPKNGDIVIANINGEVYIKRIEKDPFGKWIKLISDNPAYETFKIEGENLQKVTITGIVKAKIKIF